MTYSVLISQANGYKELLTIQGVFELEGTEEYLTLFDEEGNILLTVPKDSLAYCMKAE